MQYKAIRNKFENGNLKTAFKHFQKISPYEKEQVIKEIEVEADIRLACLLLNKLTD